MTDSLPAYAVPGVQSVSFLDHLGIVRYTADQLAACTPVAAVLGRVPAVLTAFEKVRSGPTHTFTRAELCALVSVGTYDGLIWGLRFEVEVGLLVQPLAIPDDEFGDPLENAIAAQPGIEYADHMDREYCEVRLTRVHRADEIAARWLDAIITAHREFARYRGVDLPY